MKSFGRNLTDKMFMIFGAFLVAAVIVGVFTLGEIYHIAPAWTFGLLLGTSFVVVIGKGLRRRFREPVFILFFAGWLCLHVLVMLFVMTRLAFPLWVLPMAFELWIGYALAFRLFGLPTDNEHP